MPVRNEVDMSKVRVKNGTPIEGESLCATCSHVHMQRGFRLNEEVVYCMFGWEGARRVPFKVRECSSFANKNAPTYEQMEKLAILVEPRRMAGFEREERKEELDPEVVNT